MLRSNALAARDSSRSAQAQQRERLDELTGHIRRNVADITESFFEIGACLAEIANSRLYVAGGFDSFEAFLDAHQLFTRQYARRLIQVATWMPRDVAVELGPEKSYLLVRYAQARDDSVRAVLQEKALRSMGTSELREVLREQQQRSGKAGRKASPAREHATRTQRALRGAGLRSATVRPKRSRAPGFVVELSAEDLARLVGRLR